MGSEDVEKLRRIPGRVKEGVDSVDSVLVIKPSDIERSCVPVREEVRGRIGGVNDRYEWVIRGPLDREFIMLSR